MIYLVVDIYITVLSQLQLDLCDKNVYEAEQFRLKTILVRGWLQENIFIWLRMYE